MKWKQKMTNKKIDNQYDHYHDAQGEILRENEVKTLGVIHAEKCHKLEPRSWIQYLYKIGDPDIVFETIKILAQQGGVDSQNS